MQKVTIIGTGNIAWHLAKGIAVSDDYQLTYIVGRASNIPVDFKEIALYSNTIETLGPTDIIILAVSDTAIATVKTKLQDTHALVVHTSGSQPMDALRNLKNYGVLYPLQTFTKGRSQDLKKVPFCIEANSEGNLHKIENLAAIFSEKIVKMDSKTRERIHFSAVLANNFSNHLLTLTHDYCKAHDISFDLLKPLMMETVKKAFSAGPYHAQTGPARRGDHGTLQQHLKTIGDSPLEETYKLMTNSILKTYGKKEL
ncbi:MAG: DUF2520 domain-containing protein [Leeuwenhoekiella sp.]